MRAERGGLVEVGTTNRSYLRDYEQASARRRRSCCASIRATFQRIGFIHETPLDELANGARARRAPARRSRERRLLATRPTALRRTNHSGERGRRRGPGGLFRRQTAGRPASRDYRWTGGPGASCSATRWCARCGWTRPHSRRCRPPCCTTCAARRRARSGLADDRGRRWKSWRPVQPISPQVCVLQASLQRSSRQPQLLGGGALPGETLPTWATAAPWRPPLPLLPMPWPRRARRCGDPPVVGRIAAGELLLDLRTVPFEADGILLRDAVYSTRHVQKVQ